MRVTCPHCSAPRVAAVKLLGAGYLTLIEHHVPEADAVKTTCHGDRGVDLLIDVRPLCSWSNAIVRFP